MSIEKKDKINGILRIKCTKKFARAQKIINTIISALGITDEYAVALKMLEPFGG